MPSEQITFAPSVDERQLDRETDQVNDQLQQVGEDVPVTFDTEDMDGLTPAGSGGLGGGGVGAGQAAGVGALASRIPEPIAGVSASAALPVALAGGVGVGLLSAMTSASARLGTDVSLAKQAAKNFFREPGNVLSENVTRPLAKSLLGVSTQFDEIAREEGLGEAIEFALTDREPDSEQGFRPGAAVGGGVGLFAGAKAGAFAGGAAGSVIPGAGTAAGALVGGIVGAIGGTAIGSRVGEAIRNKIGEAIPNFPGWPDVSGLWPGWPAIGDLWPGWPNVGRLWPGWPNIGSLWPGWPNITGDWPGWPDVMDSWPGWPEVNPGDIVGRVFPKIDPGQIVDKITGGGRDNNGNNGNNGFLDLIFDAVDSGQAGGRVRQSGLAEIHQGELIADPDRLVRDLADAVDTATGGGGGGTMDTAPIERKLDTLHRDLQRLASAMDNMTIEADREVIGRVAQEGLRDGNNDTDPLA